mmetsp:Transcript_48327/g.114571  ORF Transcript_48327/g.114571 Transcript_48327/m.114571 type:complete len:206 (-) Transcript_48327:1602-2219(-)
MAGLGLVSSPLSTRPAHSSIVPGPLTKRIGSTANCGTPRTADIAGLSPEMPLAVRMMSGRSVSVLPAAMVASWPRKMLKEEPSAHWQMGPVPSIDRSDVCNSCEHSVSVVLIPALLVSTLNRVMMEVPNASKKADIRVGGTTNMKSVVAERVGSRREVTASVTHATPPVVPLVNGGGSTEITVTELLVEMRETDAASDRPNLTST